MTSHGLEIFVGALSALIAWHGLSVLLGQPKLQPVRVRSRDSRSR